MLPGGTLDGSGTVDGLVVNNGLVSPGHSPGHVCINLKSGKDSALFTGDAFHHPVQVAYPEWGIFADTDPAGSTASRRAIIEKICDTDTYIMAAHFMDPTIARVVRNKDRWKLKV